MVKTTLNINTLWSEALGSKVKMRKSSKSVEILREALEHLTKDIIIKAVIYARESGRRTVTEEDMKYAIREVLGNLR